MKGQGVSGIATIVAFFAIIGFGGWAAIKVLKPKSKA